MAIIEPEDLQVFDKALSTDVAEAMITDALAEAYRVAPCLESTTDQKVLVSAKAIIRRALLRRHEAGAGALQQWSNTDGPFTRSGSVDTRGQDSRMTFYPSEEKALRELCTGPPRRARSGWLL